MDKAYIKQYNCTGKASIIFLHATKALAQYRQPEEISTTNF